MEQQFSDLTHQALRAVLMVVVPTLLVPVASAVFSVLMSLMGIRDDGMVYAIRMLVMIGVVVVMIPTCASGFVALLETALR